jgi:hypothetical protein
MLGFIRMQGILLEWRVKSANVPQLRAWLSGAYFTCMLRCRIVALGACLVTYKVMVLVYCWQQLVINPWCISLATKHYSIHGKLLASVASIHLARKRGRSLPPTHHEID